MQSAIIPHNHLLALPHDIHVLILKEIAKMDFNECKHNLLVYRRICKTLKTLVDNQSIYLIHQLLPLALKRKHVYVTQIDLASIESATAIGTPIAREWLKSYIKNSKTAQVGANHLFNCYLDNTQMASSQKFFKLKMLIDAGISINHKSKTKGESAIMRAIHRADLLLVQFLLDNNIDLMATDEEGSTVNDIWERKYALAISHKNKDKKHKLIAIKKMIEEKNMDNFKKKGCMLQ